MQYGRDQKEEAAKEYRRLQQIYITDLLVGLRKRIDSGDETPSILGNIMRSGVLKDEEILLASYTGSSYCILYFLTCSLTFVLDSCCRSQLGVLTHVDYWLPREPPRGTNLYSELSIRNSHCTPFTDAGDGVSGHPGGLPWGCA